MWGPNSSEFGGHGGTPFINGSIRGYRSWNLSSEGFLTSPTFSNLWATEEVVSRCFLSDRYSYKYGFADSSPKEPGFCYNFARCTCGFYCYYAGQRSSYAHTAEVLGVIEGYGETVIGTKGFRSKKARIIALAPNPRVLHKFSMEDPIWHYKNVSPWLDYYSRDMSFELLEKTYPNVALFESAKDMYREFPAPTKRQVKKEYKRAK